MKAKFISIESKMPTLYRVDGIKKEMLSDFKKANHVVSGQNGTYLCTNNDGSTMLRAKKENGNILNVNIENILLKHIPFEEIPRITSLLNEKLDGYEFEMENSISIKNLESVILNAIN